MSQIDLTRRHHLDAITSERWTASDQNRWTPSVRYAWTASLESANTIGRTLKKTFSVRQAKLALSSRWKSGGGKAVASRPLASVAGPPVTTVAKCTQQSCGVGY